MTPEYSARLLREVAESAQLICRTPEEARETVDWIASRLDVIERLGLQSPFYTRRDVAEHLVGLMRLGASQSEAETAINAGIAGRLRRLLEQRLQRTAIANASVLAEKLRAAETLENELRDLAAEFLRLDTRPMVATDSGVERVGPDPVPANVSAALSQATAERLRLQSLASNRAE